MALEMMIDVALGKAPSEGFWPVFAKGPEGGCSSSLRTDLASTSSLTC